MSGTGDKGKVTDLDEEVDNGGDEGVAGCEVLDEGFKCDVWFVELGTLDSAVALRNESQH